MKQKMQAVIDDLLANVTFTISDGLHKDYGGENFLVEIDGTITIVDFDGKESEPAGKLRASLVQFNQAQAQGISSRQLGDGQCQEVREYWCELFVAKRNSKRRYRDVGRRRETTCSSLLHFTPSQNLRHMESVWPPLHAPSRCLALAAIWLRAIPMQCCVLLIPDPLQMS